MSKTIRITALLAVILKVTFILVGQIILPIVFLLLSGMKTAGNVADIFAGLGAYFGMHTIDFVFSAVFVVMCVLTILAAKSRDDKIIGEIIGLIVVGVVLPLLSTIGALVTNVFVTRSIISVSSYAYSNYALLNSYSGLLSGLNTTALVLYVFATSASVCRKKWSRDEEFEKEISD